jgi:sn-glycerol 3-phosphate transport system substrate-binding protein
LVQHFQEIADLAQDGVFRYGGRTSEAKQLFLSGECGIMTESSGGLGDVVKAGMNYGIGQLPYRPEAEGAPQNTVPGGASLWVMGGHDDAEYKSVAEFFKFLSQTEVQARLHQESGYLPVTMAAYERPSSPASTRRTPAANADHPDDGQGADGNSRGVRAVTCRNCATSRTRSSRPCSRASRAPRRRSTRPSSVATKQ